MKEQSRSEKDNTSETKKEQSQSANDNTGGTKKDQSQSAKDNTSGTKKDQSQSAKDIIIGMEPILELFLKTFKNLPFDAIGMGISAVFTGLEYLYETFKKTDQEMLRLQTTLEESRKQWSSLGETQKSQLGSSLSQIEHTQHLRDELRLLADESGRIKKEDEGRANVIIN